MKPCWFERPASSEPCDISQYPFERNPPLVIELHQIGWSIDHSNRGCAGSFIRPPVINQQHELSFQGEIDSRTFPVSVQNNLCGSWRCQKESNREDQKIIG